jgi:hypothetical protein
MLKVFRLAGLNCQLSAISFLTDKEYPFRLRSKGTYGNNQENRSNGQNIRMGINNLALPQLTDNDAKFLAPDDYLKVSLAD